MATPGEGPTAPYTTLRVTRDGPVAHVELHRPKQLNAWSGDMWEDYKKAFEAIAKDGTVRCVVVSAAGKLFTAGLDLKDPSMLNSMSGNDGGDGEKPDPARRAFHTRQHILHLQDVFTAMEKCPQPVIVCAHNGVFGAGVDLMCAADIRMCTKDAFFVVKEVDIGLAADVGTLQRIQNVMGNASLVRELCYTARKMESAEALRAGFVSHVHDDKASMLAAALEMAKAIASKSPVAVYGTKFNLNYARGRTVEESLAHMALFNAAFLQTSDIPTAAMASLQKQKQPSFPKL